MHVPRRLTSVVTGTAAATLVAGVVVAPDAMAARPKFQMPFACGYTAVAAMYAGHNPRYAIDWQKSGIEGDPVRASAAGTVSVSKDLGDTSYGRYLVVSHSGGWSTLYAHLSGRKVQVGDKVSQGELIGWAGHTGGADGAHLHFEERLNGDDQPPTINGAEVPISGHTTYTSKNNC